MPPETNAIRERAAKKYRSRRVRNGGRAAMKGPPWRSPGRPEAARMGYGRGPDGAWKAPGIRPVRGPDQRSAAIVDKHAAQMLTEI
jgi:hypothetical protein